MRFSIPNAIDARGVAAEILHVFLATSPDGSAYGRVEGDKTRACFAYIEVPNTPISHFIVERSAAAGSTGAAYRDIDPRSQWVLTIASDRQPRHFHERLVQFGARDLRWFSKSGWTKDPPQR